MTIVGPSWSVRGSETSGGRFPLQVEQAVSNRVAYLAPGVTTVTPHARYFALHGLVASECASRSLSVPDAQDLMRRCEVVMAAVSALDSAPRPSVYARPHGAGRLQAVIGGADLDVATLSTPGTTGYSLAKWGFWGAYAGSETSLGILRRGRSPTPGKRYNDASARHALGSILALAEQPYLSATTLADAANELSLYRCATNPDGPWLAALFCGGEGKPNQLRRSTLQLIARVFDTHPVEALNRDVSAALMFGQFVSTDPLAVSSQVANTWRGVLLRNYSVGAWRRLWAWLVDQIYDQKAATIETLAGAFADQLPDGTVADLVAGIPELFDVSGNPAPVEPALRTNDYPVPHRELQVLAAGAGRVDRLDGATATAFGRSHADDLTPAWVRHRLTDSATQSLRDFGIQLVRDVMAKSQRVAMSKTVIREDGTLWIPSRLHQRGEELIAIAREGSGDVGTRLLQLAVNAAACGVFDVSGPTWRVTDQGRDLLD
ncbi:hypothetical protein A5669_21980 [Mycolicibacterium fortuitum]|uniref:hypothetical protein n=1 Tax=Mycolicibacterium fortuitum TaxID=1766 RepID=UPI0007EB4855|nr:hypothetical protein [Mycolicibacterium fortuitum]OBG53706.1 hypothetical protein A5669_21980 [Mycolicibacterium fortuitum]